MLVQMNAKVNAAGLLAEQLQMKLQAVRVAFQVAAAE
jgi:hypothetical protein